ncbi:hypothetical protein HG536_0A04750 [Torulaspora globosa]|uniref:Uncharacterized protein n=1 Tax=Torulaspora globosa TaxID=48254 RepID=A0A7G3ZAX3_9SACH|nr:uncharacterized protein HG536_0A04750 [Torulaspora globosa]QLL30659.1 hypothetical protein HG536_0A04750 [Torulaspora globosa]
MSANPFKNLGKNVIYVSIGAIASVLVAKRVVRSKKEAQYSPSASANHEEHKAGTEGYYDNLAQVRPGFPLPSQKQTEAIERKSEFEGPGMSVLSRKRGDRLGFLDRKRDE